MANRFEGSSTDPLNIVAMFPEANQIEMNHYETEVASRLASLFCETITYSVHAVYDGWSCRPDPLLPSGYVGADCIPSGVTLYAQSNLPLVGYSLRVTVRNVE